MGSRTQRNPDSKSKIKEEKKEEEEEEESLSTEQADRRKPQEGELHGRLS